MSSDPTDADLEHQRAELRAEIVRLDAAGDRVGAAKAFARLVPVLRQINDRRERAERMNHAR